MTLCKVIVRFRYCICYSQMNLQNYVRTTRYRFGVNHVWVRERDCSYSSSQGNREPKAVTLFQTCRRKALAAIFVMQNESWTSQHVQPEETTGQTQIYLEAETDTKSDSLKALVTLPYWALAIMYVTVLVQHKYLTGPFQEQDYVFQRLLAVVSSVCMSLKLFPTTSLSQC